MHTAEIFQKIAADRIRISKTKTLIVVDSRISFTEICLLTVGVVILGRALTAHPLVNMTEGLKILVETTEVCPPLLDIRTMEILRTNLLEIVPLYLEVGITTNNRTMEVNNLKTLNKDTNIMEVKVSNNSMEVSNLKTLSRDSNSMGVNRVEMVDIKVEEEVIKVGEEEDLIREEAVVVVSKGEEEVVEEEGVEVVRIAPRFWNYGYSSSFHSFLLTQTTSSSLSSPLFSPFRRKECPSWRTTINQQTRLW